MLIERDGKYLFVLRSHTTWMNGYYGLPSGKVEKHEGFRAAAVREAKEEVGVVVEPEDLEFAVMAWRDAEDSQGDPDMEWCDVLFSVKRWAGEPYNAEPHLHDAIAWFSLDELPENTVPHIRLLLDAYQR
ncbi:NUDIX domain-containing protein, partial [Candidatus Saccharibacteria bacterium]|nr:NUDIX domain-containing protein [Candidatus Saccharibacteria bacterium]